MIFTEGTLLRRQQGPKWGRAFTGGRDEAEDEGERGISTEAILPPLPSCQAHGQARGKVG